MNMDCVFLLADKSMEEAFKGFLGRDKFYLKIGTRSFTYKMFSPDRTSGDSGIWKRAHEYLESFHGECSRAIVVLDYQWQHEKTAASIQEEIKLNLMNKGWAKEHIEVIVIEPELEIWLWQDSPHIASAFNFDHKPHPSLKKWLEQQGFWEPTAPKPARPKDAFKLVARTSKTPYSSGLCREITSRVSVRYCTDPAFCLLRDTLQRWFPAEGGEQ